MKVINTLITLLPLFRGSVGVDKNETRRITCLGGDPAPTACGEVDTNSPCPMKYKPVEDRLRHAEGGIYLMKYLQDDRDHEDCANGKCTLIYIEFEMEIIGELLEDDLPADDCGWDEDAGYAISRGGVDYICPSACGDDGMFEGVCQSSDEHCESVLADRDQICDRALLDGCAWGARCIAGACALQCTSGGTWNDNGCNGTLTDPCEARADGYAVDSIVELYYYQNYFNDEDCAYGNCWSGGSIIYAKVIGAPDTPGGVEVSREGYDLLCPNACLSENGDVRQFCGNKPDDCEYGTAAITGAEVCDMLLHGSIYHELISEPTAAEDETTAVGGGTAGDDTSTTTSSASNWGMAGLTGCVIYLLS